MAPVADAQGIHYTCELDRALLSQMGIATCDPSSWPRGSPLPHIGAQHGVSPHHTEWEGKPGPLLPSCGESPTTLSGEDSLEYLPSS